MHRTRHHIDYSDNEEIQLPVPKRVPIIWSDEDDKALAETSSWEIRIWRKVKELYGIDATDIIPPNTTASFLSDRGTDNVPVWARPFWIELITLLNVIGQISSPASFESESEQQKTPRDLPIHSDFTKNIKRCAEQNIRESSVALGISALDFEIIINSWDAYVRENPEHGLKTVAEYSARRTERIPVSENGEILQMKKRALVNAFRRPEDRIADDAQMPEEPNDLESPNMTSDDEPPMQHQEDIGNLEYQSESMVENPPPRQSTQNGRDSRREPVAQNYFQSESEDSEYQPSYKALNGTYNRSRKNQGNKGKANSEHQPHSATRHQSSEYLAQHQSESEGSDHQPSPATLKKASDNLSVRQGRGLSKVGVRNRMMKSPSPQRGPSSDRRLSKHNPLVLAEVIAISSDDEHYIQKRSNGAGPRRGKTLPETTRTRSSEHSAQVRPKKEFEAEPITDNRSGLYAGSKRGTEDYGLEGEEVATYPMTRWEDSDIEDEDDQPEVTMKDLAQCGRKGNSKQETGSSISQARVQIASEYQYEPPNSLSDHRQKKSVESQIPPLNSFPDRSGRHGNSDYQFEPPSSQPDRIKERSFESQFPSLKSFQHRTVRERISDYKFKTSSSLLNSRQKESAISQIQPLTSSAQYKRRERSADYQLGLKSRTEASDYSNNRREERFSELNDWNSLYDEDLGDDEESERCIPGENFRVRSFGFKNPALVGGTNEVRRRRREQLESTITRNTSGSRDEDDNRRSEGVRTGWHRHTPHMLAERGSIHGALGSEVKTFDNVLLQEADIQPGNGMRILSSSEEIEIMPWKRSSDKT
ncbi:hypothetical protein BOTNAR_0055g00320 [Botryotinia narcissicola]|uniref:Uncharacterized protein n=1 Tax=Botryotinia narcissicola TaxID=278944 RepID=A0A4Z1J0W2_9HELO|nr:hypothetical protein BOTNAR_0055g00320 [Botryotinia narcissicola]